MNQYYPQGFQPYTGAAGQQGAPGQQGQPFTGAPGQQGAPPMGQPSFLPPQTGYPSFPPAGAGSGLTTTPGGGGAGGIPGMLPIEQSYIENILRLNKGKLVTVFATFEGNSQWN